MTALRIGNYVRFDEKDYRIQEVIKEDSGWKLRVINVQDGEYKNLSYDLATDIWALEVQLQFRNATEKDKEIEKNSYWFNY